MSTRTEDRISAMLHARSADVTPQADEALLRIADRVVAGRRRARYWRPVVGLAAAGTAVAVAITAASVLQPDRLEVADPGFVSPGGTTGEATGGTAQGPEVREGWQPIAVDEATALGRPTAAAADGSTVVVVGTVDEGEASSRPVVWRSEDAGASWERLPEALATGDPSGWAEVFDVTVHDGVFRAVGHAGGAATVWTSFDGGVTWATEPLPGARAGETSIARSIASASDGRTVAVGEMLRADGRVGAIWLSDSGSALGGWTSQGTEAHLVDTEDGEVVLYEVDVRPTGGFVARGYGQASISSLAATWDSVDGREWSMHRGENLAGQNLDGVVVETDRLVAVSVDGSGAMVQVSRDRGDSWQPFGEGMDLLPADGGSNPRLEGLVEIAGRYYGSGSYASAGGERVAAVWSWRDGWTSIDRDDPGGQTGVEIVALPDGGVLLIGVEGFGTPVTRMLVWTGQQDPPGGPASQG